MGDDDTAELGDLLMRAARAQRQRWRGALAPWDLSPHQVRALRVVCEREETRISDLAETLHIAPAPRRRWPTASRSAAWRSARPTRGTGGR